MLKPSGSTQAATDLVKLWKESDCSGFDVSHLLTLLQPLQREMCRYKVDQAIDRIVRL